MRKAESAGPWVQGIRAELETARRHQAELGSAVDRLTAANQALRRAAAEVDVRARAAEATEAALKRTVSWRVTAPLRAVRGLAAAWRRR